MRNKNGSSVSGHQTFIINGHNGKKPSRTRSTTSKSNKAAPTTNTTATVNISFQDPRDAVRTPLELHLKSELKGCKLITTCRANNCARPISTEDLVVRTYGNYTYYDQKTKKHEPKYGPRYLHFTEACLKNWDTITNDRWYASHERYDYQQVVLDGNTKTKLSADDLTRLRSYGVSNCD